MALCPDVASHTVNQFDGRNLLWRSVIRYGTSKIWYWPLLMTLAVAPTLLEGGRVTMANVRYWHSADIGLCAASAFDPKRT